VFQDVDEDRHQPGVVAFCQQSNGTGPDLRVRVFDKSMTEILERDERIRIIEC
jgi:hypothetical protein